MAIRILHSFTVTLNRSVTETTSREENGQRITVESKVVKPVDYTIILKEPSRMEKTDLALYKDVTYGQAIRAGLVPKLTMQQLLAKSSPTHNPLSEDEDKALMLINKQITDLGNEYQKLSSPTISGAETPELKERKAAILNEWIALQTKAANMNAAYQSVYEHTTESYTQRKMLSWLTLFLTYVRDPGASEPRPLFPGADYAARELVANEMEDVKDELFMEAIAKLPLYWSLYLFGRANTPEEYKAFDEEQAKETKLREEMAEKARVEQEAKDKAATPTPSPTEATPVAEPVVA